MPSSQPPGAPSQTPVIAAVADPALAQQAGALALQQVAQLRAAA